MASNTTSTTTTTSTTQETSSNGCCRIPLIDFSPFLQDDDQDDGNTPTDAQRAVAKRIDAVNRDHGFCALVGFGLTAAERDRAFAEASGLFALPDATKRETLRRVDPDTNTGYSPLYTESLHPARHELEHKEAFNTKFPGCGTANSFDGCPATLQPFLERVLLPKLQRLAARYAVACAVALGLPSGFFADQDLSQCAEAAPYLVPLTQLIRRQMERGPAEWQREIGLQAHGRTLVLLVRDLLASEGCNK